MKSIRILLIAGIGLFCGCLCVYGQTKFSVETQADSLKDDNAVPVAFGLRMNPNSLGYNVVTIGRDEITRVRDANFMNSLSGKVAGLSVSPSSIGVGGSVQVVARGMRSVLGNNGILYVIDGMPMPSLQTPLAESHYDHPDGADFQGIANLNPDDIESISVLTGASAAALYGYQGSNGAVLINTRKGDMGRLKVSVSNSTLFSTPLVLPDFQGRYGLDDTGISSWGSRLEGDRGWNPEDFFRTGWNTMSTVSLSQGARKNRIYASVSALNSKGMLPNNRHDRYNLNLHNTTTLAQERLTIDLGAQLIWQDRKNPMKSGLYHNPLVSAYLLSPGADADSYSVYESYDAASGYDRQVWPYGDATMLENPWWIANREIFSSKAVRYLVSATADYRITDWLSVSAKGRIDRLSLDYGEKLYASTNRLYASEYGYYADISYDHSNYYADASLAARRNFLNDRLSFALDLGAGMSGDRNTSGGNEGNLKSEPNLFSLANIDNADEIDIVYKQRDKSVYALMQLGWNDVIYINMTARKDWFDQERARGWHCFYPSAGISVLPLNAFRASGKALPYMRLRASYSESGNNPARSIVGSEVQQYQHYTQEEIVNLYPLLTRSWEAGMDMRFLKDRLGLSVTYYHAKATDTETIRDVMYSTEFRLPVSSHGIEAALSVGNVWHSLSWSSSLTFSMDRNEIERIVARNSSSGVEAEYSYLQMENYGQGYSLRLQPGRPFGEIYVSDYKKDFSGNVVVDSMTGMPADVSSPDALVYAGNIMPKAMLGWNNSFSFKRLSLGFLIDARLGGKVFSATRQVMDMYGVSEATAAARDAGAVQIGGVNVTDIAEFYQSGKAAAMDYVYDRTNVRLRELSIGYDLPESWFRNRLKANVSLTARNLWMIYCKAPFDPELSNGAYHYDFFTPPSSCNVGFSISLRF